uniref:Putative secreted protein n=1 Tax=Anopheles marajoara TaxID=58244 RepID=A0A2M4CBS0_9DIPT
MGKWNMGGYGRRCLIKLNYYFSILFSLPSTFLYSSEATIINAGCRCSGAPIDTFRSLGAPTDRLAHYPRYHCAHRHGST